MAVWSQVEAVSEQGAGLVNVAQTHLAVFWLGQQSPNCPECVQTSFGQKTPARTREEKRNSRDRTQVNVEEVYESACAQLGFIRPKLRNTLLKWM